MMRSSFMKNIKAYTYWNVGMHLAPISIFIILLSIYFKQWSFMLLYGITLFMFSWVPMKDFKRISRTDKEIEIRKDFVYARKCGKVVVGNKYLYIMGLFTLYIIPSDNITWIYGINQTVIEYTQSGEKHKRKHVYVAIHLKNKKKYKLSISENNLNILLNEVRKYQNIEIGFK